MIKRQTVRLATLGGIVLLALGSAACAYDDYGDHRGGRWDRHGERHGQRDGRGDHGGRGDRDRGDHRGDRNDRDGRGQNDGRRGY